MQSKSNQLQIELKKALLDTVEKNMSTLVDAESDSDFFAQEHRKRVNTLDYGPRKRRRTLVRFDDEIEEDAALLEESDES